MQPTDPRESDPLHKVRDDSEFRGFSDAKIVRFCFFRWHAEQHVRGPEQQQTAR
jgi:hypothetical protein